MLVWKKNRLYNLQILQTHVWEKIQWKKKRRKSLCDPEEPFGET